MIDFDTLLDDDGQPVHRAGTPRPSPNRGPSSSEIRMLEDRLERLNLVCMAMWSLLQERGKLTEADLIDRVRALDHIDGSPDGKLTRTVSKCAACDRTLGPRQERCMYCGKERAVSSAFDTV